MKQNTGMEKEELQKKKNIECNKKNEEQHCRQKEEKTMKTRKEEETRNETA